MIGLETVTALIAKEGLAILAPIAMLEGPIVTVIAAWLASRGLLDIAYCVPFCLVLVSRSRVPFCILFFSCIPRSYWCEASTGMTAIFNPFSEAGWCPGGPFAQLSTMLDHYFRFGGFSRALWNGSLGNTLGMAMPAQGR